LLVCLKQPTVLGPRTSEASQIHHLIYFHSIMSIQSGTIAKIHSWSPVALGSTAQ
jgi:hypothetical protein